MNSSTYKTDPVLYRVDDFARLAGLGRTMVYEALKTGRIKAVKCGSRTLITAESAKAFVESLPAYAPQSKAEVA